MYKIKISLILVFIAISSILSAVELSPTADLLAAYLERDKELQSAAIDYEKSLLSYQSTIIENGFDITLSTGKMLFKKTKDSSYFSVSPSAKASIPQAANLGIQVSGDIEVSAEGTSAEDLSFDFSLDIISSYSLKRQISLLKAERSVLEAKRELESTALAKEKAFYQSLDSLLSQISSIIESEQDLYEDKISFEKIKAQGYTKTSSAYRKAELAVLSDEHEVEKLIHSLKNDYKIFYMKCGKKISLDEEVDFMSLVPSDIPQVQAIDIRSLNPNAYTQTESAVWTHKINSMTRQADTNFTLAANAGFTFNNSSTDSHSVDIGLSSSFGGLTLSPTFSIPLGSDSFTPAVSLEASLSPNTFKENSITKKTYELEEKQEELNIRNARRSFGDCVTSQELELSNILWERTSNEENLSLYTSLENDMKEWYRQGIVTESEYLSAKVNRQKCTVSKIRNQIEMILYNDSTSAFFVNDLKNEPFEHPPKKSEKNDNVESANENDSGDKE